MRLTSRSFFAAGAAMLAIASLGLTSSAGAASISYPNQGPIAPGYTFTNIAESSGTDAVPLYGPPSPVLIGLDFTPASFSATSTNGGADLVDGQLNYTVVAGPSAPGIPLINFAETGSYTLSGLGNAATQAMAGAIIRATVLEVNGAAVAPISLAPVSASVGFDLQTLGGGPLATGPWSLSASVNIASQLGPGQSATRVEVVINNTLATTTQPGTTAIITKGDFGTQLTPEPGSLTMLGFALCGLGVARKRR